MRGDDAARSPGPPSAGPGRSGTPATAGAPAGALPAAPAGHDALSGFGQATRDWFAGVLGEPTEVQRQAWAAIGRGEDTLVVAPTGSGKTLAAFLTLIDQLTGDASPAAGGVRAIYLSPLKALAADVDRNLRRPLSGIAQLARQRDPGEGTARPVRVGVRTGDTPAAGRRALIAHPPDILITTPESLYLLLTSAARRILTGTQTVIVDEIHSLAGTKRGAHLAVSLERLDALLPAPAQRIGLSATVRPVSEAARYLSGGRPVSVVRPEAAKAWELSVVLPDGEAGTGPARGGDAGENSGEAEAARSIWPHAEEHIADLIAAHRTTLVFTNSRRLAERLTTRLNEIWLRRTAADPVTGPPGQGMPAQLMGASGPGLGLHADAPVLARAHHGSVSHEQRAAIEAALKAGTLPAVVATSSLELGIDMGAVDLVVQVEPPPSVSGAVQRIGRAGHQVGAVSRGVIIPRHRGELVACAVVTERIRAGQIEALRVPACPLDVLAQHVVAMCALDDWQAGDLLALLRRSAPFAQLTREVFESVLDMLAGRYPSEQFASLRPRIVWDRATGTLTGRPGAQRLAVTSGGTIPDRGLFGVFVHGDGPGRRVGELDEEMVHESRAGDVIVLGTSSWRIEQITHDQVIVVPVPGAPGRLPFWRGDAAGRSAELGAAMGAFQRELGAALGPGGSTGRAAGLARARGLDASAAASLAGYLSEQLTATGVLPGDDAIVIERFRDQLGDWRVVLHSCYGARVNTPWALVIAARLAARLGADADVMPADDGIVFRLPDSDLTAAGDGSFLAELAALAFIEPDEVPGLVSGQVGGSALFAARFRECAARALLLPRHDPRRRQALWQQRRRSAQLLEIASGYPRFPIVLEAVRECVQDVFDVDALIALMRDLAGHRVRLVTVDTPSPSPFARSLLFSYAGQFLYEGDAAPAERRAAALALDPALLASLLGSGGESLRDLLDPEVTEQAERTLQQLTPGTACRHAEDVADLVRRIGPLSAGEIRERTQEPVRAQVAAWLDSLSGSGRLMRVAVAGESRWAAVEDAGRLTAALGTAIPPWVPEAFRAEPADPLGDLVARYARSHAPAPASAIAARLGLGTAPVREALARLVAAGQVTEGRLRPGGQGTDYCDVHVLARLRRASLAALRAQVEPVSGGQLARFTGIWQSVTDDEGRARPGLHGAEGLARAIEQLAGARVPASALETFVLPARVAGYRPAMLDELLASGEVIWAGRGALGGGDGWVTLCPAELAGLLLPGAAAGEPAATPGTGPARRPCDAAGSPPGSRPGADAGGDHGVLDTRVIEVLSGAGGFFLRDLAARFPGCSEQDLIESLWRLVWTGRVSNDTFAPLRARLGQARPAHASPARPPRARRVRPGWPGLAGLAGVPGGGRAIRSDQAQGRWSLLPAPEPDRTARAVATAWSLLDRYGVLTRGAVAAEDAEGGFAAMYKVLAAAEESGAVRRGYFAEQLGAAQFATAAAIERLRQAALPPGAPVREALVLAATDPANPYGAALAWPSRPGETHRPARKAGALVVLTQGRLAAYVERGGHTLLTFGTGDGDAPDWALIAQGLARVVNAGQAGSLTIASIDGQPALRAPHAVRAALEQAGFHTAPQGMRLRRPAP